MASSPVGDLDDDLVTVGVRPDDDGRSRSGVLDGVPRDVGESFRQAVGVPGAGQVAFELQVNGGLELFDDARDRCRAGRWASVRSGTLPRGERGSDRAAAWIIRIMRSTAGETRWRPLRSCVVEVATLKLHFDCQADRPERVS